MMLQRITPVKVTPQNARMHKYARQPDPRVIIRLLRDRRRLSSDRKLAIEAGVNQSTLSRYLAGTSETMEIATWQALASYFGVTVSQLLGELPLDDSDAGLRVLRAMERLPEEQREALAAAATALAKAAKSREQ